MSRRLLHVDPHGARLDQGALTFGDHELVAQLRGQLPQEDERDDDDDHACQARDDELVLPRVQMGEGVRGHKARGQTPHGGSERPKPHGRTPSHLGREVAHERWGRHQDDALHETDHAVGHGESELGMDVGHADQLHQPHNERPIDRQVGPADLV